MGRGYRRRHQYPDLPLETSRNLPQAAHQVICRGLSAAAYGRLVTLVSTPSFACRLRT